MDGETFLTVNLIENTTVSFLEVRKYNSVYQQVNTPLLIVYGKNWQVFTTMLNSSSMFSFLITKTERIKTENLIFLFYFLFSWSGCICGYFNITASNHHY